MKQSTLVTELHFSGFALFVRLFVAALIGIIIAGLLTLFMRLLIDFSQQELVESAQVNFLDFVRVKRDEDSQKKKVKPERPKTQEAPPAPPTPQNSNNADANSALQVPMPTASADISINVGGIGTGDGEYLPIVKVAPAYPVKAAVEGIEGSCMVEFTVTTTGSTKDVDVIPEYCPSVFIRSSVAAARKFKYKPRVVDGVAIEVPNVRNIFDYSLEAKGNN